MQGKSNGDSILDDFKLLVSNSKRLVRSLKLEADRTDGTGEYFPPPIIETGELSGVLEQNFFPQAYFNFERRSYKIT